MDVLVNESFLNKEKPYAGGFVSNLPVPDNGNITNHKAICDIVAERINVTDTTKNIYEEVHKGIAGFMVSPEDADMSVFDLGIMDYQYIRDNQDIKNMIDQQVNHGLFTPFIILVNGEDIKEVAERTNDDSKPTIVIEFSFNSNSKNDSNDIFIFTGDLHDMLIEAGINLVDVHDKTYILNPIFLTTESMYSCYGEHAGCAMVFIERSDIAKEDTNEDFVQ